MLPSENLNSVLKKNILALVLCVTTVVHRNEYEQIILISKIKLFKGGYEMKIYEP